MAIIDTELPPNSWIISLLWTGGSILSIFGGILLGMFLNEILWPPIFPPSTGGFINNPIQRALVIGFSIGGIKSILEKFVLQLYKVKWDGWILASLFGWTIGVTVAVGLPPFQRELGVNQLLGGMIIGLSQWVVLRRYLPKAYWWIIASVVGSFAVLSYVPLGYTFSMILKSFIAFIFGGFCMGTITGATLSWLLTLSWLEADSVKAA